VVTTAVDSVSILFHPERWLSLWKAAGGTVYVGQLPIGTDSLLDLAPTFPLAEPYDSSRRHQVQHMRAMLALPGARDSVIDNLKRKEAFCGRY
jgi:hypothetical protein